MRGGWDGVTFSSTREAVHFEVTGALLPPVLLAVGVRRWRRLRLWTGGAGHTGTGADRVAQTSVCKLKIGQKKPVRLRPKLEKATN